MIFNDFQWLTMTFNDFQWLSMTLNYFWWLSTTFNDFKSVRSFSDAYGGLSLIPVGSVLGDLWLFKLTGKDFIS